MLRLPLSDAANRGQAPFITLFAVQVTDPAWPADRRSSQVKREFRGIVRGASLLLAFAAATLPCGHAAAQCVTATLEPPRGREIDGFCIKGAFQGRRLFVGNIVGPIGCVQLYDRVDGEWQLAGKIVDPHLEPDSGFADHPTLRGNRLLLTADDSTGTARQGGAVYECSLDGPRARLGPNGGQPPIAPSASIVLQSWTGTVHRTADLAVLLGAFGTNRPGPDLNCPQAWTGTIR